MPDVFTKHTCASLRGTLDRPQRAAAGGHNRRPRASLDGAALPEKITRRIFSNFAQRYALRERGVPRHHLSSHPNARYFARLFSSGIALKVQRYGIASRRNGVARLLKCKT